VVRLRGRERESQSKEIFLLGGYVFVLAVRQIGPAAATHSPHQSTSTIHLVRSSTRLALFLVLNSIAALNIIYSLWSVLGLFNTV
jgi:hypothetical protein